MTPEWIDLAMNNPVGKALLTKITAAHSVAFNKARHVGAIAQV